MNRWDLDESEADRDSDGRIIRGHHVPESELERTTDYYAEQRREAEADARGDAEADVEHVARVRASEQLEKAIRDAALPVDMLAAALLRVMTPADIAELASELEDLLVLCRMRRASAARQARLHPVKCGLCGATMPAGAKTWACDPACKSWEATR